MKIPSSETTLNFLCSGLGMVLFSLELLLDEHVTDEVDGVECFLFFLIFYVLSFYVYFYIDLPDLDSNLLFLTSLLLFPSSTPLWPVDVAP